jgi:aspartate aminotransferase
LHIELSQRVQAIKPSPTLVVSSRAEELRAEGRDIIGLGAGEPDFDTPAHVKAAAKQALDEGFTKYTVVDGTPGLKHAIIGKFKRDNRLEYDPGQILVSCGAKHSIFNAMQALLDPGDEVVILAPYWVSYPDMAKLSGGVPVVIETGIDTGFKATSEQLSRAITDRTRMLILNSPSNPTGVSYTRTDLQALGEVLQAHPKVVVVSDDIYEHILWADEPFSNILNACPALNDQTIVVNGVSKAYAMTGWRIGYAAANPEIIRAMKKIQGQSTSCATSISQRAAEAALNGDHQCVRDMVKVFKQRHDYVVERLNRGNGVRCLEAQGAFYAFPDVRGAIDALDGIEDDVGLAEYLLEEVGVALVPGSAFGAPGYLRLSYATSNENLEDALGRMDRVFGVS